MLLIKFISIGGKVFSMKVVLNKKNRHLFILYIMFFLIVYDAFSSNIGFREVKSACVITFFLNGMIWSYNLLLSLRKHPFSIETMLWYFMFFFMFIVGITQYFRNLYPWDSVLNDKIILETNAVLLLFTASVLLGKYFCRSFKSKIVRTVSDTRISQLYKILPILTVINFISVILLVYINGNFTNLMSRETRKVAAYSSIGTVSMIIENMLQAVSYFAVSISIIKWKNGKAKTDLIILALNALFVLVGYFPIGLPRYATAVIYLGLMLTFSDILKRKNARYFMLLFVISFCFIFQILGQWRHTNFSSLSIYEALKSIADEFSNMWLQGDYDAYAMVGNSLKYIKENSMGVGKYFLSIILFFIPRSLWKTKALAGSVDIAKAEHLSFSNISLPFPALGIMDLGIMGVVFIGVLVGYIIRIVDKKFWSGQVDMNVSLTKSWELLYPVVVIFFFFMARGDMLYTYPYFFSYLAVWFFISCFVRFTR